MARPIEATPTLYGEDAERLLDQLDDVASPEETARRAELARARLAKRSKRPSKSTDPA